MPEKLNIDRSEVRISLTDDIANRLKLANLDELSQAKVRGFEIQRKIELLEAEIAELQSELALVDGHIVEVQERQ